MPNPENIHEYKWKEGDPSPNPHGRPSGSLNSKTIIRKWLEAVENSKNPITGAFSELSQLDIITLKQLEKARKGDTRAFQELLDRMEGKSMQKIEQDITSNGRPLQAAQIVILPPKDDFSIKEGE